MFSNAKINLNVKTMKFTGKIYRVNGRIVLNQIIIRSNWPKLQYHTINIYFF